VVSGLGQYGTLSASAGGQSGSPDIPSGNQALHEWLLFGLKGTFGL
jgi:hypothetical protein